MCKPNLKQFNSVHVEFYLDVASIRFIDFLNVGGDLSKQCLLDPPLHDTGILRVRVQVKVGSDDGSADGTGCIDDLFDTWHSKSDI